MKTYFDIPEDINLLLRKYALEYRMGSRENAIIFIISKFLKELYKEKK